MVEGEAAWVPDTSARPHPAAAKVCKKGSSIIQCVTTSETCLANCNEHREPREQRRFALSPPSS